MDSSVLVLERHQGQSIVIQTPEGSIHIRTISIAVSTKSVELEIRPPTAWAVPSVRDFHGIGESVSLYYPSGDQKLRIYISAVRSGGGGSGTARFGIEAPKDWPIHRVNIQGGENEPGRNTLRKPP